MLLHVVSVRNVDVSAGERASKLKMFCLDLQHATSIPEFSELKECGLTLRVLHQADISWGTYSDSCWNPNRSKLLSQHCR